MQIFGLDAYPIFRDIIFTTEGTTFSAKTAAAYTVEVLTGTTGSVAVPLYAGRVVKRPGDTYLTVRLNDIIRGCLRYDTLSLENNDGDAPVPLVEYEHGAARAGGRVMLGWAAPSPFLRFRLTWKDTAAVEPLADVAVSFVAFADAGGNLEGIRSYDTPEFRKTALALTEPICDIWDFRQWVLLTMPKASSEPSEESIAVLYGLTRLTNAGTATGTSAVSFLAEGYSETLGPLTFFLPLRNANLGNLYNWFDNTSGRPHANDPAAQNRYNWRVNIGIENGRLVDYQIVTPVSTPVKEVDPDLWEDKFFRARETCARFCLYYVNSYGGWDSLVILGRAVESDSVEAETIERRSPSALATGNVRQRGVEVIRATVTKHLELHTHWLTDFQAARMHNLLNSPDVWVHDLERNLIFPAVLTKPGCEFKTYKNQGHRLVSYQIDLDYAVTCERI